VFRFFRCAFVEPLGCPTPASVPPIILRATLGPSKLLIRKALGGLAGKSWPVVRDEKSGEGYDTKDDTNGNYDEKPFVQLIEKNGGDDETRTRDLCRDRPRIVHWRTQNQQVRRVVVGNRRGYRDVSGSFCATVCATRSIVE
jgi:hypothetical protein